MYGRFRRRSVVCTHRTQRPTGRFHELAERLPVTGRVFAGGSQPAVTRPENNPSKKMTFSLRLSTRTFAAALPVNFPMTPIEGHTAYWHSKLGLRPVNTHGPDDDPDWSASFDDMDGGDWGERVALFEPDDDRRDREGEQEALELDRQVGLHYDRKLFDQAYAANLELIVRTATLSTTSPSRAWPPRPSPVLDQPSVDEVGEPVELRAANRCRAPIPRRHREPKHLPHTLTRDPKVTRRRALAHPIATRHTDLPVQIHGVHPPALPVTGKGHTGRDLPRRGGAIPPQPWSNFSPPFPERHDDARGTGCATSAGKSWYATGS